MQKLGDVNFILEDVLDNLAQEKFKTQEIYQIFYSEAIKNKKAKEIYVDGGSPRIKINNQTIRRKKFKLNKKTKSLIRDLFKNYEEHELQYHEIFGIIHFYIMSHRPDLGLVNFYYGP